MNITARYARAIASLSLVLAAALSLLWVALQPVFAGGALERLEAVHAAGATSAVSAFAFCVAQLPFIIGVLGIAQLTRARTPLLTIFASTIAVLGGFGHAITGGFQLSQLAMASDSANHELYAALLDGPPPVGMLVTMMVGTLGTVVGLLLLGITIMRAHLGPRWVPFALWGFILVEFIGTGFTVWASLASGVLYLAAFAALGFALWRSPLSAWQSTAQPDPGVSPPKQATPESAAPAAPESAAPASPAAPATPASPAVPAPAPTA